MARQEGAFLEKVRKSEGLESLEGDFYTRFKPKIKDLGLWRGWKDNIVKITKEAIKHIGRGTYYGKR